MSGDALKKDDLEEALFTGENPSIKSSIFEDSSDEDENPETVLSKITLKQPKKGNKKTMKKPPKNVNIEMKTMKKYGGKRTRKMRKRRTKKRRKRGGMEKKSKKTGEEAAFWEQARAVQKAKTRAVEEIHSPAVKTKLPKVQPMPGVGRPKEGGKRKRKRKTRKKRKVKRRLTKKRR